MTVHRVTVHLQRAWNEWCPECTCRWVGSYWPASAKAAAEVEASGHLAAHVPSPLLDGGAGEGDR